MIRKLVLPILAIGILAAFASCENKTSCTCKIINHRGEVFVDNLNLTTSASNCDGVDWDEFPEEWSDINAAGGFTFECIED